MPTPLGEIEAAIKKLTAIRGNGEPWVLTGGGEWINPIGITVAPDDGGVSPREADLIVTLHRTIDAQLAMLRWASGASLRLQISLNYPRELALARSINGGA